MSDDSVHEWAYAKLNLFLEVTGRRDDGYHELYTVMHEIDLCDELRLTKSDQKSLVVSDPSIPCDQNNLAYQALSALEKSVGQTLNLRMELTKNIPAGGGLGGGSADAAAVIRGANRLFQLGLGVEAMREVAALCGSDTAFFIEGGTAVCRGRGEKVTTLSQAPSLHFVLLMPPFPLSTPDVYDALILADNVKEGYDLLSHLSIGDASATAGCLFNRLEAAACQVAPELQHLMQSLAHADPHVSGSGSTVFFVRPDRRSAEAFAAELQDIGVGRVVVNGSAKRAKGRDEDH